VRVLVVNAGSSSLKLVLLGGRDEVLGEREIETVDGQVEPAQVRAAIETLAGADAVGHRIVHGGDRFTTAVRVDADVAVALRALTELAPLHQPQSLAALDLVRAALPDVAAVACFDTAFHATLPEAASTYALPAAWRARWPLKRYGFHGLSHAWVARRVMELAGDRTARIVSCHLGAGASVCAIVDGHSIDTTMGFTPLDGLVMATRSGSVDPGLVLWLTAEGRLSRSSVEEGLEREAGLLGLAGTADMREILTRGDPAAKLARDVYVHRLRGAIAAMASSMGGLDALAFTGGVGENAPAIREFATAGLGFLGIELDRTRNAAASPDAEIGADGGYPRIFALRAREDLEIARQVRAVLHAA
jgi:acetate kinase